MNEPIAEFPPNAPHRNDVALLAESLASVVGGRTAWYVSSPLTSGERSDEWRGRIVEASGPSTEVAAHTFERDVLSRNRSDAAKFVEALRGRERSVVIDPTALAPLPEWSQPDYLALWARVIEKYVATIVFRDGWQYSSGCAWEFLSGYRTNCTLLREDLSPLDFLEGRSLLAKAVAASGHRANSAFLTAVLSTLDARGLDPEWHAPS